MSDSFKFWSSYWDAMGELTMEQRGMFVTALCSYVFDDEEVDVGDPVVRCGYMAVRGSAIESRDISRRARESGKSGGRGNKRQRKGGAKSTAKSPAKSTPLSSAKSTPLSTPLSSAKAYSSVGTVGSYATSSGSSYAAGASRAAAASVGGSAPQDQPQPAAYDDEMVRLYGPLHGALGET